MKNLQAILLSVFCAAGSLSGFSVTIEVEGPDGEVVDRSSAVPNYALVLYRADGVTEVHHADLHVLSDKRTWSLNPDFVVGETAVLKVWKSPDNWTSQWRRWSSWGSSDGKVLVGERTLTMQEGGRYLVQAHSRAAEGVVIEVENTDEEVESASPRDVVLRATGDVTVIVEQVSDRSRLFQGSLNAGDTVSLERDGPISIRFTDGEALVIERNGREVSVGAAGPGRTTIQ